MRKIATAAIAAGLAVTGVLPIARADDNTTIYVQGTIPLDKGKPTFSGGATHEQTRGNTTTKVDASTDGKKVDLTVSATQKK
jgi:hypothetical protein